MNIGNISNQLSGIYKKTQSLAKLISFSSMFLILGILIVSCNQEEKPMDSQNVEPVNTNKASGLEGSDGITKYQLDNGLTVILEENHSSPVVAVNVWVKTGSACEVEGEYGLAHVHEHMLFKGTEKEKLAR